MDDDRPKKELQFWDDFNLNYPSEVLDSLALQMGGMTAEQREIFKSTVFKAARVYAMRKYSAKGRTQPSKETAALEKLAKATQAVHKAFHHACELSLTTGVRIYEGAKEIKPHAYRYASSEFGAVLDLLLPPKNDNKTMKPWIIEEFLDFLNQVANAAVESTHLKQTDTKNSAIVNWVHIIFREWADFTDLRLTVGRYDNEYGYNNIALTVLKELMGRLDPDITPEQIQSSLRKVIAGQN